MISQQNLLEKINKEYHINDNQLCRIIKCDKKHVEMLRKKQIDMTADEIMRIYNYLHIVGRQIYD